MIGQIIQSYLVSLGVQIDKPGFQQADATIRQTGDNIERVTGGMARNFVKASTIIASAMASVTASAVGLMKATANEDLAMQKYAKSMMMGEAAAWNMKKATDALGESINDIAMTPELFARYKQLTVDGAKMMPGGDFKQTMKDFRDLMFEFTRLKQEASYALNWVGYYLMKYLQKPLADIREKFKTFNDMVIKNMSVWTEKIARGIYYVLEVGRHFLVFLTDVGKHLKNMWDSFPDGVKKAIVAITDLQAVLSAGPLGRAIMLISALLLLIDDYYGYMEGKDALLGKYWDKLNNFLDTAKQKYEELKATVEPYWDKFIGYIEQAKKWFDELMNSIDEWSSSTGAEILNDFIDECKDWWQILNDLYDVIENGVKVTWQSFMETLEKNDTINDVRQLLERLWRIFVILYKAVKDVIDGIIRLADEIAKTEEWKEFIAVVGELFDGIVELFDAIMELVEVALTALFGEFHKTDTVLAFRDVLRAVLKIFTGIIRAVNWVIGLLKDLFKLVAGNTTFKKFWEEVGKEIGNAIEKIGKFGSKLRDLWDEITGKKASAAGNGGKGGKAAAGVDAFMQALGEKESGNNPNAVNPDSGAFGKYQIMPENWSSWAQAAGLPADAPKTEENQDIVARHKLLEYYKQFGNWGDVAVAWYAGPGAVSYSEAAKNRKQYSNGNEYPSINDYKNDVLRRYYAHGGKDIYDNGSEDEFTASDEYDTSDSYHQYFGVWSSAEQMNAGWNSDVTNTRNFLPRTKDFLNFLGPEMASLGYKPIITGGAEVSDPNGKPYHDLSLDYSHAKGYKVDIDGESIPPGSGAARRLKYIVEHIYGGYLDYHGGHWDITIPPGKGMRKMSAPASTPQQTPSSPDTIGGQNPHDPEAEPSAQTGTPKSIDQTIQEIQDTTPKAPLPLEEWQKAGKKIWNKGKEVVGNIFGWQQTAYNNMSNFMPSGGNYNPYALGLAGGGGGSVVINNRVEVGDVNINGNNLTNGEVGRIVANRTVEAQADFFLHNTLGNINSVPTADAIAKANRV